ncbi:hypothetical protein C7379_10549 [Hallella colorans]|uniref:Uncharacterized protein n=1 Tax=Hallella colorans TaxID=1703337 RepID=A0A2U0UH05_9BACT|nr:hypothetical protein C7379_10549 [Hallella colorans]
MATLLPPSRCPGIEIPKTLIQTPRFVHSKLIKNSQNVEKILYFYCTVSDFFIDNDFK